MRKVATENRATIFHIDSPSPKSGQASAEVLHRVGPGGGASQ